MLVWCMLVVRLNDELKSLDNFLFQVLFPSGIELTMVLRMVYWCTPIGITLQRSISYTLPSFDRHWLLYFLSKHMCKLQSKLLAHMLGEQLVPYGVHKTCPYPFTHGKYAWASNMDSIEFNSYLCIRVVINYQKGGDWKL